VTYDGFAYMGDKVIARPVFFPARVEFAFQFGVVLIVEAGAQHSLSPELPVETLGDENSLRPRFLIRRSILLAPIVFSRLKVVEGSRLATALHIDVQIDVDVAVQDQ
jgi:hypothetical protein